MASTLGCCDGQVKIFDFLHTLVDKDTRNVILNIFKIDGELKLEMVGIHKQIGENDCGLFAIAVATALAFGSDPDGFQQSGMRAHLLKCFEVGLMTAF